MGKPVLSNLINIRKHDFLPVFYVTNICKIYRSINPNNHNSIVCICFRILFTVSINSGARKTAQDSCNAPQNKTKKISGVYLSSEVFKIEAKYNCKQKLCQHCAPAWFIYQTHKLGKTNFPEPEAPKELCLLDREGSG